MSNEVVEERREVHCLSASLSEQDFERVGGASGLEGFRLTVPSSEKKPLPYNIGMSDTVPGIIGIVVLAIDVDGDEAVERLETSSLKPFRVEGIAHGVESSWAAIVSSILASPPMLNEICSKFGLENSTYTVLRSSTCEDLCHHAKRRAGNGSQFFRLHLEP
jgi:hypothetical protein